MELIGVTKESVNCWSDGKQKAGFPNIHFECLSGKLKESTIWITHCKIGDSNRYAVIHIKGDCTDVLAKLEPFKFSARSFPFYFNLNDANANQFLVHLDSISQSANINSKMRSEISKVAIGYSFECVTRIYLASVIGIMLVMNADDQKIPEITKIICRLVIDSWNIEFAKDNTEQFYLDFSRNLSNQALKEYREYRDVAKKNGGALAI